MTTVDYTNGLLRPGHAKTAAIPTRDPKVSHITPQFFDELRPTDQVDETTGTKKFVSVEYVRLLMAGSKDSPVKRVTPQVKQQFPDHYAAWKATRINPDMIGDGIPLTLWPACPPAVAKSLELLNIYTVQHLAGVPDTVLSNPSAIGLRDLREKAKTFLESAKTTAPIARLEAENGDLKRRLDMGQEQMKQMLERMEDMQRQLNEAQGGAATAPQQTRQQRKARTTTTEEGTE